MTYSRFFNSSCGGRGGFDLSPMRGKSDVAILIGMCSSMGIPHTELVPYANTGSKHGMLLFDADHRLVACFYFLS